jgi:predicted nucleic acid-binding Zn ribbon protein
MPAYGYRCPNGHEFEVTTAWAPPRPTASEVCGATPVHFTGAGFYATDYGRSGQRREAPAYAGDSVKTSDDGAKKTDEKSTKTSEPD